MNSLETLIEVAKNKKQYRSGSLYLVTFYISPKTFRKGTKYTNPFLYCFYFFLISVKVSKPCFSYLLLNKNTEADPCIWWLFYISPKSFWKGIKYTDPFLYCFHFSGFLAKFPNFSFLINFLIRTHSMVFFCPIAFLIRFHSTFLFLFVSS